MRRCCCPPGCIIEEDDFNRSNSTTVGPKWFEESGPGGISGNELQSIGAFLVRTVKEHDSERMVVRVSIRPPNSSLTTERNRVLVNYLDTSNYLYVQFDSVFSGVGTPVRTDMRFVRRSGGVDSQVGLTRTIDAANVLSTINAKVCYDGNYLSALNHRENVQPITNGRRAGLQYTGTLTTRFDDFRWTVLKSKCPNCSNAMDCSFGCPNGSRPSNTIIADLGGGGWIDGTCTNCDQVAGDHILSGFTTTGIVGCSPGNSWQGQCFWGLSSGFIPQGAFCSYTKSGTIPCWGSRCLMLRMGGISPTTTRWELYVAISTLCNFTGAEGISEALYSFDQTPPDCAFSSITLTKVFEQHRTHNAFASTPCSGNLPTNVELRQII